VVVLEAQELMEVVAAVVAVVARVVHLAQAGAHHNQTSLENQAQMAMEILVATTQATAAQVAAAALEPQVKTRLAAALAATAVMALS
jgi:hypothetical protein